MDRDAPTHPIGAQGQPEKPQVKSKDLGIMDDHAMRDTLKGLDQVKERHGVLVIAGGRGLRLSRGTPGRALRAHTTAAEE